MVEFPEEVIMEIFARLPLGSIMKLCHAFPAVVLCREFERLYYLQSSSNPSILFVKFNRSTKEDEIIEYRPSSHSIVPTKLNLMDFFHRYNPYQNTNCRITIVGCCNGLVLCTGHQDELLGSCNTKPLHLVNPVTRCSVEITSFKPEWFDFYFNKYALGYSPRTGLYKVVSIDRGGIAKVLTVLGNNTKFCWRSCRLCFSNDFPLLIQNLDSPPVALSGAIYWLSGILNLILRFDIDKEEFDLSVPTPYKTKSGSFSRFSQLTELCGSLGLVTINYGRVLAQFEVWVMKECGVKESWWTRLTTIMTQDISVYPGQVVIDVLDDGKILMKWGSQLRVYDLIRDKWDDQKPALTFTMDDSESVITNFMPSFLSFTT